jgi:hypothetical protein
MTVAELKIELSKYPDNMEVFVSERMTEFAYGLVNSVSSKRINFMEEPDGEVLAQDRVVIISED